MIISKNLKSNKVYYKKALHTHIKEFIFHLCILNTCCVDIIYVHKHKIFFLLFFFKLVKDSYIKNIMKNFTFSICQDLVVPF